MQHENTQLTETQAYHFRAHDPLLGDDGHG